MFPGWVLKESAKRPAIEAVKRMNERLEAERNPPEEVVCQEPIEWFDIDEILPVGKVVGAIADGQIINIPVLRDQPLSQ